MGGKVGTIISSVVVKSMVKDTQKANTAFLF